jgi:hypothetical protein
VLQVRHFTGFFLQFKFNLLLKKSSSCWKLLLPWQSWVQFLSVSKCLLPVCETSTQFLSESEVLLDIVLSIPIASQFLFIL